MVVSVTAWASGCGAEEGWGGDGVVERYVDGGSLLSNCTC